MTVAGSSRDTSNADLGRWPDQGRWCSSGCFLDADMMASFATIVPSTKPAAVHPPLRAPRTALPDGVEVAAGSR